MGFAVLKVWDERNHEVQRAAVDFLKMAWKRFDKNDNEQIVNSAIPKTTQKATQFGMSVLMVSKQD